MKAYSNDLREKIVSAYASNNYSQREIAELFGVSESTVKNFVRRKRQTGSSDALPHGGGQPSRVDEAAREFLRTTLQQNNDRSLEELCVSLQQKHKVSISLATMCRLLQALGLPRKKSRFAQVSNSLQKFNNSAKSTVSR